MTMDGTGVAIAPFSQNKHSSLTGQSLKESIRTLADLHAAECSSRNVEIVLDLAPDLPPTRADAGEIQTVIKILFSQACKAIAESGEAGGTVFIKTKTMGERVQVWLTHEGALDSADPDFLTCAQIVQIHRGELWAWRPRCSALTTIIVDLPAQPGFTRFH